ncbi:uncharacterized protein BDR25DRAFT_344386 [Lindgomyces ingoldianus]|uniref:Uncharacterized protein n=1 Tax=Lindgomyces ingoldianus TaxID=673940 RepID=A0ACB6QNG7_9PLEO|nr:uncharacterized protein BDR25DRAFT_344386 [Lindgomyces ingoldianus]KAF2468070.1 hypothetical protein BDR25DRAFT_344386 [Lindgomyces ingoldianus]
MKLSWGFLFSSLLYCSASASRAGHAFLYDPKTTAASQQVTPETARLILAQRLGLSQFHSIKHANDEVIEQLNAYGGRPQRPFGDDSFRNWAHALVWIEDVRDVAAIIKDPAEYSATFTIAEPPCSSANDRLIQDMVLQAESLPRRPDPRQDTYNTGLVVDKLLGQLKPVDTYNDYLTVFHADKTLSASSSDLSNALAQLVSTSVDQGFSITVVLMPPPSSHSKRAAHPYGTYDLPSSIEARREKSEALLSPSSSQPSTTPQNMSAQTIEKFPALFESGPVLGILPRCFESLSDCKKQTHNCTGHGKCDLLHKGETGKDATVQDCYGCRCDATVIDTEGGGSKTTYWGGPACQKKDVSVPFWLFAGSGVLMAFLISAGIGMLYSIGNEELPSVIGAGVSGPVRK